ncbi:hypothetical protein ACF1AU_03350 [Streptomyces rubrogriseus]|uniref:hypothetical protein n=1 Tax=Streptomyces rubrogriseus TaxID=194673 RepID=UPI0037018820
MSEVLAAVEPCVREEDVPEPFRAVVRAGWSVQDDAQVLTALHAGYSGFGQAEFGDSVHYEAAVNGRGMTDYDLPEAAPERLGMLLNRSLSYACMALLAVPSGRSWPVLGYVSLSYGGVEENLLTAHVTFCSQRPDLPSYVGDMSGYAEEALMEIAGEDVAGLFRA